MMLDLLASVFQRIKPEGSPNSFSHPDEDDDILGQAGDYRSCGTSYCGLRRVPSDAFRSCISFDALCDDLEDHAADWWSEVDIATVKSLEEAVMISELQDVQIVRCTEMWMPCTETTDTISKYALYIAAPHSSHVTLWLTFQKISIVLQSKVVDVSRYEECLQGDCMMDRLKLVVNPVNLKLPVKNARNTRYAGVSFGKGNVKCIRGHGTNSQQAHLQINLASKWALRVAMQQGLKLGNIFDVLLVDWPGHAVLAAARITVTPKLQELMQ